MAGRRKSSAERALAAMRERFHIDAISDARKANLAAAEAAKRAGVNRRGAARKSGGVDRPHFRGTPDAIAHASGRRRYGRYGWLTEKQIEFVKEANKLKRRIRAVEKRGYRVIMLPELELSMTRTPRTEDIERIKSIRGEELYQRSIYLLTDDDGEPTGEFVSGVEGRAIERRRAALKAAEKRRQKRLADPEYQQKMEEKRRAKEEKDRLRQEERERQKSVKRRAKARADQSKRDAKRRLKVPGWPELVINNFLQQVRTFQFMDGYEAFMTSFDFLRKDWGDDDIAFMIADALSYGLEPVKDYFYNDEHAADYIARLSLFLYHHGYYSRDQYISIRRSEPDLPYYEVLSPEEEGAL